MDYITPKIDLAFKKIFGVEGNEDLLLSLVNSIVSPEDQVSSVRLLSPYNLQSFRKDKLSILDIKAVTNDNRRLNIEIQITDEANYDKRALYYWAKLYTEQLQEGDAYGDLYKAIGIHILQFTSIPNTTKYHNVFHIKEKDQDFVYFKDLELHTIELPKFQGAKCKDISALVQQVKNALDMWVAYLTRHNLLVHDPLPPSLDNPALKKALHELQRLNFTPEERDEYEGRLKFYLIEQDALLKQFQNGEGKGREERTIEIVQNMLAHHLDIQLISQTTGLAEEEIRKLQRGSL